MAAGSWPASTTSLPGKARRGQNELGKWSLWKLGASIASWRSRPKRAWARKNWRVHWSWASPPGVPKARQGSPSRRASDGLRVVRGRVPGRSELASPSSSQSIWARVPRQKPRPGTTGELCSQPPLGVAATRLPCRSTTSTWQVSPKVGSPDPPARRASSAAWPRPGPGQAGGAPGRRPGSQLQRRLVPDQGPAAVGVGGVEQAVQGHVEGGRVAVPGLPVGEGELGALGHRVDVGGAAQAHRLQVEPVEQAELLEQHRALAPRAGLAHRPAAVLDRHRRLHRGPPAGQVVAVQQPLVAPAAHVHDLGGGQVAGDRLGHEPLVEGGQGGLDLAVPVRAGRLGLLQQPPPGRGQGRVAQPPARGRHPVGQPHLGRGGPLVAEQPLHGADRPADPRDRREPGLGVADGRLEHVAQAAPCRGRAAAASRPRRPRARRRPAARCPGSGRGPGRRNRSMVAAAGTGPCPFTTSTRPCPAGAARIGASPPGPFRCGSTTWSTKPAATAASKALPPRSSTAIPAAEASQWVEDTIPKDPRSSGRVANTP